MAKKTREQRNAARTRKLERGQFKPSFADRAAEQTQESTVVSKTEKPETHPTRFPASMSYGQVISDALYCFSSQNFGLASAADREKICDFLNEVSKDELVMSANKGEGVFDYLKELVNEKLPVLLRSIAINAIRRARESANMHLEEHNALKLDEVK